MKKYFLALIAALACSSAVFSGSLDNPTSALLPGSGISQVPIFEIKSYNAIADSEANFNTSYWNNNCFCTFTANNSMAPDGQVKATLIDSSASVEYVYQDVVYGTSDVGAGKVINASVYIKAGNASKVRFELVDTSVNGTTAYVVFNPANGNISAQSGLVILQTLNVNGARWWRAGVSLTMTGAANPQWRFYPSVNWSASETNSTIWGAQAEPGSTPSGYIPTNENGGGSLGYGARYSGRIGSNSIDPSPKFIDLVGGSLAAVAGDVGKVFMASAGGQTVVLPSSTTVFDGWYIDIMLSGGSNAPVTIDASASNVNTIVTPSSYNPKTIPIKLPFTGTASTAGEYNSNLYRIMLNNSSGYWNVFPLSQGHGHLKYTASGSFSTGNLSTIWISGCAAGGGGGGSTGVGTAGGTLTFGALLTLNGGAGGGTGATGTAAGGTGGGGTAGFPGISSGAAIGLQTQGGGSPYGQGALGRSGLATAVAAAGFCAGGRAGGTAGIPGGGGEFAVKIPIAVAAHTTYTITINAVGGAGTDATSAPTAGTGGLLLVEW